MIEIDDVDGDGTLQVSNLTHYRQLRLSCSTARESIIIDLDVAGAEALAHELIVFLRENAK